jgi:hypothetical protein
VTVHFLLSLNDEYKTKASYEWTMVLRLVKIHFFESPFNSLLGPARGLAVADSKISLGRECWGLWRADCNGSTTHYDPFSSFYTSHKLCLSLDFEAV